MSKGPGLYSDIGKKARELLYEDYQTDHKFSVTTHSPATGVAITSSGLKKGDLLLADVVTQLKKNNLTADVKVDTESNLFTTVTINDLSPGLKTILSFKVPDQRSGRAEVQYLHDYAGICSTVGLTVNPVINFSAVVGSPSLAFGTDLSFDTKTGDFPSCNFGISYSTTDLIASLTLNDMGDTITASYYHLMDLVTNTAIGSEITRSFSSSASTLTVGAQTSLDPLTVLKTRVSNTGKVSAVLQHEWRPRSFFSVSGEIDARAINQSAKVGLALALKP
ncbi:hypothetical protein MLD38_022513 [Melastoma candidum]|uniref:Uncharacterized protein n=1 Tax=Melastoma candidum TaxID=119954 RepID=A0ACB9QK19_9MYRT|nr:hypothetical protein MLD38_022513 [Melastoma candidum]